jgi:hypothetical protein
MRFLSIGFADETTGWVPSERYLSQMSSLIEELSGSGALVEIAGLRPTRDGFRLRWNKGKLSRTDGPFTESKEVVGGYAIFECKSEEEVVAHIQRFFALDGGERELRCEVRRIETPDAPR